MTSPDDAAEVERRVHGAHLLAMRAAPFVLWVAGLLLLASGLFLERPGEVAVTTITAGLVLVVTGAVLPRATGLEAGKDGVKAPLERIADLDGNTVEVRKRVPSGTASGETVHTTQVVTEATAAATHPTPTGIELLAAVRDDGWRVEPLPGKGARITKTNIVPADPALFSLGDSVTVTVQQDLSLPVAPWLMRYLEGAGFTMPTAPQRQQGPAEARNGQTAAVDPGPAR